MKKLNFKKLNQAGLSHHMLVPVIVVAVIGVIGLTTLRASKAAAPTSVANVTATPYTRLTSLINTLYKGGSVYVTKSAVTVAGPVTDATARPIVYDVNGVRYFAYTQGTPPLFNATPAMVADTFATIKATGAKPRTVKAHLDKAGNLVDPNFVLVGYSTGGDSSK